MPQYTISPTAIRDVEDIIDYRIIDEDIEIMRVIRGDRNLEAIFEEKL